MAPKLKEFTEAQAEEIRKEVQWYLRPYRIRFYAILVGFLVMLSIGAYGYQQSANNAVHDNCVRAVRDRKPLIVYLGQVLKINRTATKLGLLKSTPPPLKKLEDQEVKDLVTLYLTLQSTPTGCVV